ncbi:MAG TPA: hypothetical protein VLJ88_15855 [Propionibacteriaceae bacterium]|nr:hypothetical protein [Propionibacteriaceae bacterium]
MGLDIDTTTDLRPRPPGRRQAAAPAEPVLAPHPILGAVEEIREGLASLAAHGPHPIFTSLIEAEPKGSYVRAVFGIGYQVPTEALTPDAVHDPPSILDGPNPTIDQVRRALGMDPLRLDMGARRATANGSAW